MCCQLKVIDKKQSIDNKIYYYFINFNEMFVNVSDVWTKNNIPVFME